MADAVLREVVHRSGLKLETVLEDAGGDASLALQRVLDTQEGRSEGSQPNSASSAGVKHAQSGVGRAQVGWAGAVPESSSPPRRPAQVTTGSPVVRKRKQARLESFFAPRPKGAPRTKSDESAPLEVASARKCPVATAGGKREVAGGEGLCSSPSATSAGDLAPAVNGEKSSESEKLDRPPAGSTLGDGGTGDVAPEHEMAMAELPRPVTKDGSTDESVGADGQPAPVQEADGQSRSVAEAGSQQAAEDGGRPSKVGGKAGSGDYSPVADAAWKIGEPTPYEHLARTFEVVCRTSSRTKTVELLSDMMRAIIRRTPQDLLSTLYLCSSRLAPPWEAVELGMGGRALGQALREATGASREVLARAYVRLGDMGDIAQELKVGVRTIVAPRPLTVPSVYSTLRRIANDKGAGSIARKKVEVKKLFVACQHSEIRWIMRTLVQNLRIGAVVKTILVSLTRAIVMERGEEEELEEATASVVGAYSRCSSFDVICELLLSGDSWRRCATECPVVPGVPMKPQLGRITRDPGALLKRFSEYKVSCEFKYDGQRAQIHLLGNGGVRVFSRHLEDISDRYASVGPASRRAASDGPAVTAVIDAEVVAVDRSSDNALLPFQTLANRSSKQLSVCVVAFDLLYLDGEVLLKKPLEERRALLSSRFALTPGEFVLAEARTVTEEEEVTDCLQDAIKVGAEGLMCKALDGPLSTYEPAVRSDGWAKIKKDYVEGLSGSLDLVPIAAWWGNGRKAGWLSPFLLAVYSDGEFQSLCKVMSGYTDSQYRELTAFYKDGRILPAKPAHYVVGSGLQPSVWLEACRVWEVKGADFTLSPVHMAAVGLVHEERGVSVRFPRFIGFREDKDIEDATTAEEIADMYCSQASQNTRKVDASNHDDD